MESIQKKLGSVREDVASHDERMLDLNDKMNLLARGKLSTASDPVDTSSVCSLFVHLDLSQDRHRARLVLKLEACKYVN